MALVPMSATYSCGWYWLASFVTKVSFNIYIIVTTIEVVQYSLESEFANLVSNVQSFMNNTHSYSYR